ncbi:MAG: phosphoribosyltransferase family protein [Planctomycetota bacterium]
MVHIDPKEIAGPWVTGFALDDHTVSSSRLAGRDAGRPAFDTTRSEMGELLYRLKFGNDMSVLTTIVAAAARFVRSLDLAPDLLVPVPPSKMTRGLLVPPAIAEGIAERIGVPVCLDCVTKEKQTPELKNVSDRRERLDLLDGAYRASERHVAGKKVLLVDDLYRSGATLRAVTNALYQQGDAAEVRALTLTRTRSLR